MSAEREREEVTPEMERHVRRILWLGHGHEGMYGDDGEMQCAACMVRGPAGGFIGPVDWKRAPLAECLEAYDRLRMAWANAELSRAPREEPSVDDDDPTDETLITDAILCRVFDGDTYDRLREEWRTFDRSGFLHWSRAFGAFLSTRVTPESPARTTTNRERE